MEKLEIYFDGGNYLNRICWYDKNRNKYYVKRINEARTNNELEYWALLLAMRYVKKHYKNSTTNFKDVRFYGDSQLVIGQVSKGWRVNYDHLRELNDKVMVEVINLGFSYDTMHEHFTWVRRNINYAGIHLETLMKENKRKNKYGKMGSNAKKWKKEMS